MSKIKLDLNELYKKKLGKHTLEERVLRVSQVTMGIAGDVYHYTSPEGVLGILKNRNIYFTDAQFLNDYKERISINEELKMFWYYHYKEYSKDFYSLIKNININSYEDDNFAYIDGEFVDEPCRYFILSASMSKDSLSMWKYYSKDGSYNGYNIGLFIPALDDEWIDRETGVAVNAGRVIYESITKQEKINKMVNSLYEIWCTYNISEELNKKIINEYKAWVSYASLYFKDKCFCMEDELRFVAVVPKSKLKELSYARVDGLEEKMYDFRIVNGVLIPYIKMPLFGWNVSENWITNRIGVGPCMDFIQKKTGLLQFIDSLNYRFNEILIVESEIPVRY